MSFNLLYTQHKLLGYITACSGAALVVIIHKLFITSLNHTTLTLSFLLVVQISALISGLGPGILASLLSVLCFNFFFIPPVGTLSIEDSENLVALLAFLVTAIITSKLSSAARTRTQDAERRREEVWELYKLSCAIIATPDSETAISSIAKQVIDVCKLKYCAVYTLAQTSSTSHLHQVSVASSPDVELAVYLAADVSDNIFRKGEMKLTSVYINNSSQEEKTESLVFAPLKVGAKTTGVISLTSEKLERGAIETIAGLVALALERAKFLQEVSNTEALRQSNKVKSAILASVSHNLRTPLTAIRTCVDSLLHEDFALDKAALHEFHLIISEEAHRLTKIVDNLLEMARIEAKEFSPKKQWSSVSELISNTLERCSSTLSSHDVIVEVSEKFPSVKIDSQLLAEALTNLLENAAKYSPPKSKIKINAVLEKDELIISVEDEGPGILVEELEKIFDKFYRGKGEHTKRVRGTGMGLAIARGIVEIHNGKIWAENLLNKGTAFKFSLPVEYKDVSEFIFVEE